MAIEKNIKRPYVYELDLFRTITMLTVVLVHVLSYTAFLNGSGSAIGTQIQNAFVDVFHSNRDVFMFVSAFALVYVYHGKSFSALQFWKKRSFNILLPYIVWSVLYVFVDNFWTISLRQFVKISLIDLLNGEASFQLYFILITIQFYIIFPLFLAFINRVKHHPWLVLGISFLIQVVWLYWDYTTIQMGKIKLVGFWHLYEHYREHIIFSYEFYFILGAMAAIYFPQIRTFLLRHSKLVTSIMLVSLVVFVGHYFLQVLVYHEPIPHANAVTQPLLAFYGVAMIFFLFMLASRWAQNASKDKPPRGFKYWHAISDASFGVYLTQVFVLDFMLTWILPALPNYWPVVLRVSIAYIFTAGVTLLFCILLLRIPVLSRLVGRDYKPLRPATPKPESPVSPSLPDPSEQRPGQIAQTLS